MKSFQPRIIKSEEVLFRPRHESERAAREGHANDAAPARAADMSGLKESQAKEVASARQQGYREGLADGLQQGKAQQKKELLQTITSLATVLEELSRIRQRILAEAEGEILDLALATAEKVIHLEVTTNRDVIQGVLREAIRQIADREQMKICIHPEDFRYMMEIKADFLQSLDGVKNVLFEADESIPRGGALIETLYGEVDARLDQQQREIKTAFLNAKGQGPAAP